MKVNFSKKLPLKLIFIVPFVLQIITIVGIVGYLSFKTGQKAVQDLANQLMHEISDRPLMLSKMPKCTKQD